MSDIRRAELDIDQQLPTFVVFVEGPPAQNKSMISIAVANGSTKVVSIRSIKVINDQNNAVVGLPVKFEIYKFVSHNSGNLLTPISMDTLDTLSADVTVRSAATINGEIANVLSQFYISSDDWGSGTLDVEAMSNMINTVLPIYQHTDGETKPLMLRGNEGVHIKCITNSTVGSFDILITFTVE